MESVDKSGGRDDGSAVLVVVHNGYVEFLFEAAFYFKTFGGFDVLQVDTAESGSDSLYRLNEFFGVFFVDFDVENVDTAVNLKEQAFAFHHGLSAYRANVAEAEHRGAVRNHSHEVAFVGVFVSVVGIFLNLQAGLSHAGRISQRQVGLRSVRFCGNDLDLSRAALAMVTKSHLFGNLCHFYVFWLLCGKISYQVFTRGIENVKF